MDKRVQTWITFAALIISLVSLVNGRRTDQRAARNERKTAQLELLTHTRAARNALGGQSGVLSTSAVVKRQQLTLARDEIDKALAIDDQSAEAYFMLSWYYYLAKDRPDAEKYCDKALSLDRQLWKAHILRGEYFKQIGRLDLAIAEEEKALEGGEFVEKSSACNILGNINLQLGHLDTAIAFYRRAIDYDAQSSPAWNNLGYALYLSHKASKDAAVHKEALLYLQKAADLSQNSGLAWNNLAILHGVLGNKEAAEKARAKASLAVKDAVQ
jgi:tetratricopeptide (TPR) repeat protein